MDLDLSHELTPKADVALSFDRTIDRRLVHRRAVAEVFLTDLHQLSGHHVAVATQLPICHAYFGENAESAPLFDPLLVLEVSRQATLASAHTLGVPTDITLISGQFQLQIVDPGAIHDQESPTCIRLDSEFTWTRMRRGGRVSHPGRSHGV